MVSDLCDSISNAKSGLKQLGRACDVGSTSLKLKCGANKIEDRATPGLSNEIFVRLLP